MKKSSVGIVILLIIAAVVVAVLMNRDTKSPNPTKSETQTQSSNSNANQASSTGSIEITKNMIFTPSQITVAKGGTVTWTNNDSVAHTVTEDNGVGPDSGSIEPGATYSYTYKEAGSYQYHCKFHPAMRGTIVVK